MVQFLLIILFAAVFANASPGPFDGRIMGGTATTIEKYPFIVHVERSASIIPIWTGACSASILTPRWLLSSAHCYEDVFFTPSMTHRIRAGTTTQGTGGTVVIVQSRNNHPEYVGMNLDGSYDSIDHDISLLYLVQELVYSDVIQPGTIISQRSGMPHDDAPITHIGWGRLSVQGAYPSSLQEVRTFIVNREECGRRYQYLYSPTFNTTVSTNMICSSVLDVGGMGPCDGDSGGPLLYYGVISGLVSWGYSCGNNYYPSVNTRVSSYTDWIVSVVG